MGDWLTGLGSGIAGAVGGLATSALNAKMQKQAQQWQTSERMAQQAYQTQERLGQQAYQTSEREAQNQYSEDMYNKYQSPQAMFDQLSKAGFNPRLMMNNASTGNFSASSGSNGGAPSSGAPSGQSTSVPYMSSQGLTGSFADIASALNSLSQSSKNDADAAVVKGSLSSRIKQEELKAAMQEFELRIQGQFLPAKLQAEIDKLNTDVEVGKATKEQLHEVVENMKKDGRLKDKDIYFYEQKMNALLDNLESQASKNYADANKANVDANSTLELLPYEKDLKASQARLNQFSATLADKQSQYYGSAKEFLDVQKDIEEINKRIAEGTETERRVAIEKGVDLLESQIGLLKEQIEKAKKENDNFWVLQCRGALKDVAQSLYLLNQMRSGKPAPVSPGLGSEIGFPYN